MAGQRQQSARTWKRWADRLQMELEVQAHRAQREETDVEEGGQAQGGHGEREWRCLTRRVRARAHGGARHGRL